MKWTRGRRHHSWWFIDLEMKVSWWSRLRKGVQDPCVVGADEPFPCLAYLLSWSPVTRVLPPWQGYDHETGRIREGGVREIGGHEIEDRPWDRKDVMRKICQEGRYPVTRCHGLVSWSCVLVSCVPSMCVLVPVPYSLSYLSFTPLIKWAHFILFISLN